MTDTVIKVENLSKQYRIGSKEAGYRTFRETLVDAAKAPFRHVQNIFTSHSSPVTRHSETFWALKDVSFEVKRGEVVGIIGRNGAGKSTLLKILSKITDPTEGRVELRGRVGSLLEVGTGFHPELSGHENIYLYGAILGMDRWEITRKFDEIVAFAELAKFIDTPVKRYSSGMYMRLAFAVAAHLEPEILLVDEVLAVGDAAFQKKCLGKMGDVAQEGRTVLFVSHNMGAMTSLTQKCVYLQNGGIIAFGKSREVIEQYLTENLNRKQTALDNLEYFRRDRNPESPIKINKIWVDEDNQELPDVQMVSSFNISIQIDVFREIHGSNLTIIFKNIHGERIAIIFSWDQDFRLQLSPGKHIIVAHINDLKLSPGKYLVDIGINQSEYTRAYEVIVDYPIFKVFNHGQVIYWPDRPWGAVHCDTVSWEIIK